MSAGKVLFGAGTTVAVVVAVVFATRGFTISEMAFAVPLMLGGATVAWLGSRIEDSKPWEPPGD